MSLHCYGSVLEAIEEVGANPEGGSPHHCEENEENKACSVSKGAIEGQFSACKGKHMCTIEPGAASGSEECSHPHAHIFVQYKCEMEEDHLIYKYIYGFLVACLNVVVGLVYFFKIEKMIAKSKVDYAEYDSITLTAGDYSVEIYVEEIYKKFVKEKFGLLNNE